MNIYTKTEILLKIFDIESIKAGTRKLLAELCFQIIRVMRFCDNKILTLLYNHRLCALGLRKRRCPFLITHVDLLLYTRTLNTAQYYCTPFGSFLTFSLIYLSKFHAPFSARNFDQQNSFGEYS